MKPLKTLGWWRALLGFAMLSIVLPAGSIAQGQDQQDDPPTRVARLGYLEGSVSFQPAGETDWVGAVPNRPMTTGDQLWADKDSRAELQLGSAVIRLSANTGVSFLNLDDHTVQLQLSSGAINVRVRRLNRNDIFEIDTPNLAFSVYQPGSYRLEASEDGTYTVVSIRTGDGEATGNGQTYSVHAGQRATFSGTNQLNADVEQIGEPDQFDGWADARDHRYDDSRSAQYLSRDVVGYDDLDDNGDWRDDPNYGHVWFPNQAPSGWAPYREGHWDWIDPWGYTWVDDSAWGYAPFHYGRWVSLDGRWGWVPGPPAQEPVYAPALVVFIGAGGAGFGGNVGWFPLGPREVYVPSYPVSAGYMNQVNVSNTTVSTTTVTNVYNTTIINNKTTNITNVTYVNRNVQGGVTAVPQRAFASAQPVAKAAVAVSPQQIAAAPLSGRVAVAPTPQAVLGAKAATANHVTAPPAAIRNRQVVAKATPPPPPVPFAQRQQAMSAHPGVPLTKHEMASLRPATSAAVHPMVKQAPPGKPATPTMNKAGNQPPMKATNTPSSQPVPRPGNPPAASNRPPVATPPPNNRPQPGRPEPSQPAATNRPESARPTTPAATANRPPAAQPANRPAPKPAEPAKPAPSNRPAPSKPPAPTPHPATSAPNAHPEQKEPAPHNQPSRPASPPPNARPETHQPPPKPQTPEEKKQEEQRKQDEKPPGALNLSPKIDDNELQSALDAPASLLFAASMRHSMG
jgi:hypothetical protein